MTRLAAARAYWAGLERAEQGVLGFVVGLALLLVWGLVGGGLGPTYFLYLVGLVGMYVLLSFGLNVQWGYAGLINFSVAAFFGLGAYGTALLSADNSPVAGGLPPVVGLVVGLLLAAVLAVLIGIPTLRLRADYLAIASLGLAEVVRLVVLNEREWTNGSAGLRAIPGFFEGWPLLETFPEAMPTLIVEPIVVSIPGLFSTRLLGLRLGKPFWQAVLNVGLVFVFVAVSYLLLRHVHRSPWGRVLRTIRSDEDLAEALGKDTYAFKMQAFVLGSVVMALAGVFYAHLNLFVSPGDLNPINTFYVWIAVILGGSGSNRGAMFGGFVVIAIREGTRFVGGWLPDTIRVTLPGGLSETLPAVVPSALDVVESTYATVVGNFASTRLLLVGLLIIVVMLYRPQGVLPPQRELIWPSALEEADVPEHAVSPVPEGETGTIAAGAHDAGAHEADASDAGSSGASARDAEVTEPGAPDAGGDADE